MIGDFILAMVIWVLLAMVIWVLGIIVGVMLCARIPTVGFLHTTPGGEKYVTMNDNTTYWVVAEKQEKE